MAQVCGAEPGAGGATGLELKGRGAAVSCRGTELMAGHLETPSTAQARSTEYTIPSRPPGGLPVGVQACPRTALRTVWCHPIKRPLGPQGGL